MKLTNFCVALKTQCPTQLGPRRDSEFRKDTVQVRAHRSVREVEALANLAVGESFGCEARDLQLLRSQLLVRLRRPRCRVVSPEARSS